MPLLFVPANDDTDGDEGNNGSIVEDLTSVQLENDDVIIDMEGGVYGQEEERNGVDENSEEGGEEEGLVAGTTEPPPTPTEKEEIVFGIEENEVGKIKEEEEEELDPGLPATGKQENDIEREKEIETENDIERETERETQRETEEETETPNGVITNGPEATDIFKQTDVSKPRSTSNMSATEETIQLARALSESLTSPVVEDAPSLVLSDDGSSKKVPDKILSAWLPSTLVHTMLTSGRKVSPDYLTQPGLIAQTGKV